MIHRCITYRCAARTNWRADGAMSTDFIAHLYCLVDSVAHMCAFARTRAGSPFDTNVSQTNHTCFFFTLHTTQCVWHCLFPLSYYLYFMREKRIYGVYIWMNEFNAFTRCECSQFDLQRVVPHWPAPLINFNQTNSLKKVKRINKYKCNCDLSLSHFHCASNVKYLYKRSVTHTHTHIYITVIIIICCKCQLQIFFVNVLHAHNNILDACMCLLIFKFAYWLHFHWHFVTAQYIQYTHFWIGERKKKKRKNQTNKQAIAERT